MFYLIDKPAGMTSFDVIRRLRKVLGITKMGHSGTLDPFATGCLLIATGNSTKLLPLLEGSTKEYEALFRLDGITETLDRDSRIEPVDTTHWIRHEKEEVERFLLSQVDQLPPKYSALRKDGVRAYDRARRGEAIIMDRREIHVHAAQVTDISGYSIEARIHISSGGYIRSFGPVLGNYFGTDGGYTDSLRRIKIHTPFGVLTSEDASNIDNPTSVSYSKLFHTIPTYKIDGTDLLYLKNGVFPLGKNIPLSGSEKIFLSHEESRYMSLCEWLDGEYKIVRNDV